MKILYYDCFAGISGGMNLAVMIGLGVEPEYLRVELSRLGLDHEFELNVTAGSRHGIRGVRVDVALKGHGGDHAHDGADTRTVPEDTMEGHVHHHAGHDYHHAGQGEAVHEHAGPGTGYGHALESREHAHHHHEHHAQHGPCLHGHAHHGGHRHGHAPHRNLPDIEAIILGSTLADEVKRTSMAIFREVAEAEATVHGKPLREVHFHEVGATDSIMDIVGAAICFHRLGVDAVWSSPVELGGGASVARTASSRFPPRPPWRSSRTSPPRTARRSTNAHPPRARPSWRLSWTNSLRLRP